MEELEKLAAGDEFFQDFLKFLKYLEKQPITRTAKGNISRKDIEVFSRELECVKKIANEYSEYGWKIVGDWQLRDLDKIRVLCEVMFLTYKRQGQIHLSKKGKGFVTLPNALIQFREMVLHFWVRVNWGYFDPSPDYSNRMEILEFLQREQNIIWQGLLENGQKWIEFGKFTGEIEKRFNLQTYFSPKEWSPNKPDYSVIEYGLIRHNLELFGLVETEGKITFRDYCDVEKLKPTKLGLYMFREELERPLYSGVRPITDLWKNWS